MMNLFIHTKIFFHIMLGMACCVLCTAEDDMKKPSVVYNYITAATYFPVPSLENNPEYFISITEQISADSISIVKTLLHNIPLTRMVLFWRHKPRIKEREFSLFRLTTVAVNSSLLVYMEIGLLISKASF